MDFHRVPFVFFLFWFSIPLIAQTHFHHEEKQGLVSIEVENYFLQKGWEKKFYYTGDAMRPDLDFKGKEHVLTYRISFNNPGEYRVFMMGNRDRKAEDALTGISFALKNEKETIYHKVFESFDETFAPRWLGVNDRRFTLNVPDSGTYQLQISCLPGTSLYLDKIVLHVEKSFLPSGIGPMETLFDKPVQDPAEIIVPPAWSFGVLYGAYTNQEETIEAIDKLVDGDFPIDAYWIDSYFWDFDKGKGPKGYVDFIGDTIAYPDVAQMWDHMRQKSIKSGIWVWNLMHQDGNEAIFREFNKNGHFKSIYTNRNGWHNADRYTITGVVNFEQEKTVELWKERMKPFFDKGLDFLKLDNSADSYFAETAFSACQEFGLETKGRAMIMAHLSATNDERSKLFPIRWSGDAKITWSQPDYPNLDIYAMGGFKENVQMVADPFRSTYAIPFFTNDTGGYDYFRSEEQSDELFIRWFQFSSFNTIMSLFSTAKNPTRNHPYNYSETVQDIFRKYSHNRLKLFPYIYSAALNTRFSGQKMIQGDGVNTTQFMLGDFILVAPVVEKGAESKKVYFPEGNWYDFETGKQYSGGQNHVVPAPLDKIPWFVKEGGIVPMRKYARSVELGTNDKLDIHLFPSDIRTEYALLEDDGISEGYRDGKISKTLFSMEKTKRQTVVEIRAVEGSFEGMSSERKYQLILHNTSRPKKITVNGTKLSRSGNSKPQTWTYDRKKGQVRILIEGSRKVDQKLIVFI